MDQMSHYPTQRRYATDPNYDQSMYFADLMGDIMREVAYEGDPAGQHRAYIESLREPPGPIIPGYTPGDLQIWADFQKSFQTPSIMQRAEGLREQYGPSYTIPRMWQDIKNVF